MLRNAGRERGQGNGQELRGECLRDTDHYTLPLAEAEERRQFEWKQESDLEGKGSKGDTNKGSSHLSDDGTQG